MLYTVTLAMMDMELLNQQYIMTVTVIMQDSSAVDVMSARP